MNDKEFAEKYAGWIVSAIGYDCIEYSGRIIGYNSLIRYLAIEAIDNVNGIWNIPATDLCLVVPINTITNKCRWLEKSQLTSILPPKQRKPQQKVYPNKCSKCSSPARKCVSYIFCSNAKCKTRKTIPIKNKSKVNRSKYLQCPKCGTEAVYTNTDFDTGIADVSCDNYHNSAGIELKVGVILRASVRSKRSGKPVDYILTEVYGGYRWEEIKLTEL